MSATSGQIYPSSDKSSACIVVRLLLGELAHLDALGDLAQFVENKLCDRTLCRQHVSRQVRERSYVFTGRGFQGSRQNTVKLHDKR